MKTVEVIAYHDETECKKSNWLYHAFILVPRDNEAEFKAMLAERRTEAKCTKRVHYSKLRDTQGSRYELASLWAEDHKTRHPGLNVRFMLLGLDMPKLTFKFQPRGPLPKKTILYNWSWRVALKGALSFLFEEYERARLVKVYREFSNLKPCDKSLTSALRKISSEGSNFEIVTGACRMINPLTSDEIQLADVLAGVHRQNIEGSSNADACKDIAKRVSGVTHRLITNPYNKNSRYYKRYSISFYPKQTQAIHGDGSIVSGKFYHHRTLKGCSAQQRFNL